MELQTGWQTVGESCTLLSIVLPWRERRDKLVNDVSILLLDIHVQRQLADGSDMEWGFCAALKTVQIKDNY